MKKSALLAHYHNARLLNRVYAVLHWEKETMMPKGAAMNRGELMEAQAKVMHEKFTDEKFVAALAAFDENKSTDSELERQQFRQMKIAINKATAHDTDYVGRLTKAEVEAHEKWVAARKAKDFSLVQPALQELVSLSQEGADRMASHVALKSYFAGRNRYEILLDNFEPGFAAADLRKLLGALVENTRAVLPKILEKQKLWTHKQLAAFAMQPEEQRNFSQKIAAKLGLNFNQARLDVSVHPFMTNLNRDIRITTRCNPTDLTECLYSVIHETGHALYEQNLPAEWNCTPVGDPASSGIHESQSRFWENMIGRSAPFARFLQKELAQMGRTASEQEILQHLNQVRTSFIRTDADEVTYNLHIALRFQIEEELIMGKLAVKDIPSRWNAEFEKSFGLRVEDESVGCLQDIHWFSGAFGYFPTYSLGNLLAAELFAELQKAQPNWGAQVEVGEFGAILEFLRTRVHSQGSCQNSPATIQAALGRPLGAQSFAHYIQDKYL